MDIRETSCCRHRMLVMGLGLLMGVKAFALEGRIPTIMIAQRSINTPMLHGVGEPPLGPLLFERFFRERNFPIIVRASSVSNSERPGFGHGFESRPEERERAGKTTRIYRSRRSIADRINDVSSSSHMRDEPMPVPHKKEGSSGPHSGHPKRSTLFHFLFFLVGVVLSGAVGYHMGKVHEARNYVRLPSNN